MRGKSSVSSNGGAAPVGPYHKVGTYLLVARLRAGADTCRPAIFEQHLLH